MWEWERRRDLSLEALALTEGGGDDALRLSILNRIGLLITLPELLDERLELVRGKQSASPTRFRIRSSRSRRE